MKQSEDMNVNDLRQLLEGEDLSAVEWRTNPENLRTLSLLVDRYAQLPGGKAAAYVMTTIRHEAKARQRSQEEQLERKRQVDKLKDEALNQFVAMGGTAIEFDRRWPEIRENLLVSGRADEMLHQADERRRAKAARTF